MAKWYCTWKLSQCTFAQPNWLQITLAIPLMHNIHLQKKNFALAVNSPNQHKTVAFGVHLFWCICRMRINQDGFNVNTLQFPLQRHKTAWKSFRAAWKMQMRRPFVCCIGITICSLYVNFWHLNNHRSSFSFIKPFKPSECDSAN